LLLIALNDTSVALAEACAGARPYSIEEVSVPRFYDASDASWIWGIVITSHNLLLIALNDTSVALAAVVYPIPVSEQR